MNSRTITYKHGNNFLKCSIFGDYLLLRYIDYGTNIVYEASIPEKFLIDYRQIKNFDQLTDIVKAAFANDTDNIKLDFPVPTKNSMLVNIVYDYYLSFTITFELVRLQGENTFTGELKKDIARLKIANDILTKRVESLNRELVKSIKVPIIHYTHHITSPNVYPSVCLHGSANANILWVKSITDGLNCDRLNKIVNPETFGSDIISLHDNIWKDDCDYKNNNIWHDDLRGMHYTVLGLQLPNGCKSPSHSHSTCVTFLKIFDYIPLSIETLIIIGINSTCFGNGGVNALIQNLKKFKRVVFYNDEPQIYNSIGQNHLSNTTELYFYNAPQTMNRLNTMRDKFVEDLNLVKFVDTITNEITEKNNKIYGIGLWDDNILDADILNDNMSDVNVSDSKVDDKKSIKKNRSGIEIEENKKNTKRVGKK